MTDQTLPSRSSTTGRDLKFAGTIAAGLCAGVLGVGAIAVPLMGWNDWPEAQSAAAGGPITLVPATESGAPRGGGAGGSRSTPGPRVSAPTGAVALVTAPGATPFGTTAGGGVLGAPSGTGSSATGTSGTGSSATGESGTGSSDTPGGLISARTVRRSRA